MSVIDFTKIQSTGNDFVVVNFASVTPSLFNESTIQKICHRHFGIGADGLIALEKSDDYAFRFHYYNADGSRAAMCGNGLRAAMRFAYDQHWVTDNNLFRFIADDGVHQGIIKDNLLKTNILVKDVVKEISVSDLNMPHWIDKAYTLNTGVPHLVLICNSELENKDIITPGRILRYHDKFKPDGTNVNFVRILENNSVFIRTYERGVENETLSCGTGVTASSLVLSNYYNFADKVVIKTNGGILEVTFEDNNTYICGPSECSFSGSYKY